ncbi:restriction endonuclease subunit S [Novosphingobium sp.]|uniref:restriction endonuclease subunit S n=1 Tax=Novosphingobium sp. TaxID=1874826 RepID=UPI00286DA154|nr:restriction endonuclease subunit S [Novosphingobium sp.]
MKRLSDISEISMGATPSQEGGGTQYLRLGNVVAGQIVGEVVDGGPPLKGSDTRLQVDDILVRGRGPDLTAAVVGERHAGSLPTVELFLVRVNKAVAEPAYIVAYINQPHIQADLAQAAQGTGFVRLNRPTLADLEIPLPSLIEQRMIGSLALEAQQEQSILQEIAERKKQLHSELLHLAMAKARAGEIHPQHERNTGLNDAVTSSALPSVPKQKVP